jgi:hypothetical protein
MALVFINRDIERYLDKGRAGLLEEYNGLELIIYPIILSTSTYFFLTLLSACTWDYSEELSLG